MRVLFFTGKGGVGKSTLSAATAWQLSQQHRVLIVSLDPAHNLGDVFGVTLNHRKHRFNERLQLQEVDLARQSRAYLQREIDVMSDTYRYMQAINLEQYFSVLKYSPGLEEYTLLTAVEETIRAEADAVDYLVFDTPPTGLTLRLLALPSITLTWLERLIALRRQILRKRYTIRKIKGPPEPGEESGEVRLAYDEGEDKVLERLLAMQARYEHLNTSLQGEDAGVALVFNPDALSFRETERLITGLRELAMPVRLLLCNKVTEGNAAEAERISGDLRALAGGDAVPVQHVGLADTLAAPGARLYDIPETLTTHVWT